MLERPERAFEHERDGHVTHAGGDRPRQHVLRLHRTVGMIVQIAALRHRGKKRDERAQRFHPLRGERGLRRNIGAQRQRRTRNEQERKRMGAVSPSLSRGRGAALLHHELLTAVSGVRAIGSAIEPFQSRS